MKHTKQSATDRYRKASRANVGPEPARGETPGIVRKCRRIRNFFVRRAAELHRTTETEDDYPKRLPITVVDSPNFL